MRFHIHRKLLVTFIEIYNGGCVTGRFGKITKKPGVCTKPEFGSYHLTGGQYYIIGAFWRPLAVKRSGFTVILVLTANHTAAVINSMNVMSYHFQGMGRNQVSMNVKFRGMGIWPLKWVSGVLQLFIIKLFNLVNWLNLHCTQVIWARIDLEAQYFLCASCTWAIDSDYIFYKLLDSNSLKPTKSESAADWRHPTSK